MVPLDSVCHSFLRVEAHMAIDYKVGKDAHQVLRPAQCNWGFSILLHLPELKVFFMPNVIIA